MKNDEFIIDNFKSGIHNRLDPEIIPKDAAQDSKNWLTIDSNIELMRGREVFGDEGLSGQVKKIHIAYNTNGTAVYFRQTNTAFQYLNGSTWTNTNITTLTSTDNFTFTTYQNLYQNAVYIAGPTGLYKINVSNPANVLSYPKPTISDRYIWGYMTILDGRGYRWNVTQPSTDLTGLYLSFTDKAFTTGTALTNQVLGTGDGVQTVFTGTLPSVSGLSQPQAITFNTNPVTTTGLCDLNGNVQWTGVTGTVNLTTGAYSLTFAVAPAAALQIRANYSVVDDTNGGILQNIKSGSYTSATAFENKALRQDEGGDPIKYVVVGIDGNVFSLKENNTYRYVPDATDTAPKNEVYRKDLGIQSLDSAVSTSLGIFVINTTNRNFPELILLEKNPLGDNILSTPKMEQFDFSKYFYDQLQMTSWDRFIVAACKSSSALAYNDTLLMMDLRRSIVDVVSSQTSFIYKDKAILYSGSPFANTTWKLFTGFTVDDDVIQNYWISKYEDYAVPTLKKEKRFFIKGSISTTQRVEIYISADNEPFRLIGTVRGDQDYVDATNSGSVGYSGVGEEAVGGGGLNQTVFDFLTQIKVKQDKYRVRAIKFVATGIGYVKIDHFASQRIEKSEMRIPSKYRVKQNVSKDGTTTDVFPFPNT